MHSLSLHNQDEAADAGLPLDEVLKSVSGPLVVLPECARTNGKGVLNFAPIFDCYDRTDIQHGWLPRVHIIGFAYPQSPGATHTTGSGAAHVARLLAKVRRRTHSHTCCRYRH